MSLQGDGASGVHGEIVRDRQGESGRLVSSLAPSLQHAFALWQTAVAEEGDEIGRAFFVDVHQDTRNYEAAVVRAAVCSCRRSDVTPCRQKRNLNSMQTKSTIPEQGTLLADPASSS